MAFTAIYNGEERGAWGVPKSETAYCTDCGEEMYIQSQSKDGRARHFNHYPDRNGSSSGGGGGGCGGGESDEHKKWKNFAAERLHEVFGDRSAGRASVEEPLAAPHSDKEDRDADACVFFEDWDDQFGRGLAVEVQHKNKDKDKDAVQKDYAGQDVAVVWLSGDDFHDDGLRFGEVDFRHHARQQTSICKNLDCFIKLSPGRLPPRYHFDRPVTLAQEHITRAHDPREAEYNVPATILADWVLPNPREYWRNQGWDAAFRPPNGEYSERKHRAQAAVTTRPTTVTVEATVPHDWYWPTTAEYWRNEGWGAAFRSPDGRYPEQNHVASGLVASLPASTKPTASLPEPARDQLFYESDRWLRHEHNDAEFFQPLVFDPSLPFSFVFEHLSNPDKLITADLSRPPTRFDDVQCLGCGHYQYAPNAGLLCPTCGKAYDWEWNVETGRIKESSIPDDPPVR